MNSRTRTARQRAAPEVSVPARGELVRPWLLAALAALCVARPLLPSEGVSWIGDGQPFNLAWLVLAALVCLWMAVRLPAVRFTLVDASVVVLVLLCWVSGVASCRYEGSPRFIINMLWEWTALGLVFLLARQLIRSAGEIRALVAVMIALAVVVSCYGYYQVYVTLPADRAAYQADPDGMLRATGQWYPPGSPERALFESRLNSTEPLATFALTNSLAGFLVPWLIAGLGVLIATLSDSRGDASADALLAKLRALALVVALVAVAGCLLLTKSRSAYVAFLAGLVALPFVSLSIKRRLDRRLLLAGAGLLLLLVSVAVALRGVDAPVLSEAAKSLGYRLEYWRSTLAMIRHHFLLGVGPGSFQDFYTQYKLPQASEEIRDPHNLLLEVWATCGTPALIAFCTALAGALWFAWRSPQDEAAAERFAASETEHASRRSTWFLLAGGAAGFVVAFLVGPLVGMVFSEEQGLTGLVVGATVVAVLWTWIRQGSFSPRLAALALVVLSVHLLASGGITFPGVAYSFWLLAALALCAAESPGSEPAHWARLRPWQQRAILLALGAVTAGGAAGCLVFGYRPVVHGHEIMSRAAELAAVDPQTPAIRVLWLEAAKADPWAAEPLAALAEMDVARLRRNPTDEMAHLRFTNTIEQLNLNRIHSSSVSRQIGQWLDEIDEMKHEPAVARTAVRYFRRAVVLYPNSATTRGEYARALVKTEQLREARRQAGIALTLDGQMPHADKKLPAELKQKLESLSAETVDEPASKKP